MDPTPRKLHDKRRRQQRKACDLCRRRKVRCDIVDRPTGPCSVCEKSGLECRSKWTSERRSSVLSRHSFQDERESQESEHPGPEPGAVTRRDTNPGNPGTQLTIIGPEQAPKPQELTQSDNQEKLAREGLARFFKHGIGAAAWAVFASTKSFRIAYVGTAVSNLVHLSVLMAGAHACPHPLVANDRHAVQNILFRRASMLYHMRHESDRMHLLQAAALFTWHIGDGDTVAGGPWYWAGIAVLIGTGSGAHRNSPHLPAAETAQYRRCWWSAFFCEVFSALETGRPCAVRAEDIDQLPLRQEDMTDTGTTDPAMTETSGVTPDFLNHLVDLAYIGLDVISLNAPARDRMIDISSIDARLGLWSLRSGISTVAEDDDSWTCHLRMHYNLLLLHLHRNLPSPSSSSICSAAAQAIVTSLEKLSARDELRQCHFTSVSAVTAAGIQFAGEIRAAVTSQTFLVAINALERLSRLLRCTLMLARHWPNAEAVHSVFEELHREYEILVTQRLQGEQVMVPESPPDWNRLLGAEGVQQFNFVSEQDWMNINSWTDLL
ncbi:putative cutinase transcription factor 1 beta [Fusarium flagelliforme]|uniref:Putative cutinase transcription factor 1 beta n=1 Tax=Fusarium flagelliforme TaxID=2675880 RepID=A0A395MWE0_9HYPO|nr:putative cutinase transcription factor 1 beta [Fusarium flagelliforme]